MKLTPPEGMPSVRGLNIPEDFYWVLRTPAALAGMAYPSWPPVWSELRRVGLQHVVCLTNDRFPYDPSPLSPLHAVRLTDLVGGLRPEDPSREKSFIRAAVSVTLSRLSAGEGVVVQCAAGTGRAGTVLGCVLRELGYPSFAVIRYLDDLNRARGRDGWPESGWQASVVEEFGSWTR
jgi:hypothetical protein